MFYIYLAIAYLLTTETFSDEPFYISLTQMDFLLL